MAECNGFSERYDVAEIAQYIDNPKNYTFDNKNYILGEQYLKVNEKIFPYKNTFVKIGCDPKQKYYRPYFRIMSNYIFKISRISINVDKEGYGKDTDLELEVTDFNNNTFIVNLPAKDKDNLACFRKILNRSGNLIDFFSNTDFRKILCQLYADNNVDKTHIYKHSGLIKEHNVWLYADEVISLED